MAFDFQANASLATRAFEACPSRADHAFGPAVAAPCRQGFDFTLMFEQSVLSIGPSSLLLLVVPLRLFWLYRANVKIVKFGARYTAKALVLLVLAAAQMALVILWVESPSLRTGASIPSAVLSFAAALAMYSLSYMEHTRSIRPSTLLEVYLLFSVLLDIPQARTLFIRHNNVPIAAVYVVSIAAKLVLWALESRNKAKYLKEPYHEYPPEATRGIVNRVLFCWLNSFLVKGFKGLLSINDVYRLDPGLSSESLRDSMQAAWDSRSKPEHRHALLWACARCLRWPLLAAVPPRICLIAFNYAQPFLITRLISFVSEPTTPQTHNHGLGLIAATALVYCGIALSTVRYMHQVYRTITMLRGALIGIIFNKTLLLRDGVFDESAAVTLMSTDVDRIALSMQSLNEVWGRLVEVAIGVWLLSVQLGAVSVVPIIVVLVGAAMNTRASKYTSGRQKVWNSAVQTRISSTASMLSSMKSVKMMGLADSISKSIQDQRMSELNSAKGYRWMVTLTNMIGYTPAIYAPVLTFVTFAIQARIRGSEPLSTNQALTSLSIVTLMTQPASLLLTAIPETLASIGCFERIQAFLLKPSWMGPRGSLRKPPSNSGKPSSQSSDGDSEIAQIPSDGRSESRAHETMAIGNDKVELTGNAIYISNLTAKASPSSQLALKGITLQLPPATLTILAGPVGSGKSTLLKVMLGEIPKESGTILMPPCDIAYCPQSPWIMNTSILQNICGLQKGAAVDEQWYRTVLHACALEEDMEQLPNGDLSVPGSRGLTLSGGQKQRVALARAIYTKRSLVLLDDILSALDKKTESLVVDRLLGPRGLLRKLRTTVILVTHSTRHFELADHIVLLTKEGTIGQQGDLDLVRRQEGYIRTLLDDTADIEAKKGPALTKKTRPAIKGVSQNDITDLARKTGDVAVYKYYLKSIGWFGSLCFLACASIFVFCMFFPQIWLVWWTEAGSGQVGKYISVYIMLSISAWIFRAGTIGWILLWVSPKSSAKLHQILLRTAVRAPQSFYSETDTGVTLNRFSQDIGLVDRVLPLSGGRVALQLLTIFAQAALIAQGSSYMAITIPFCIIAVYILQKIYLLTSRQLRFLDLEAKSPVYTHFLECLEGLLTIRTLNWEQAMQESHVRLLDTSQRPYYLLYCLQRWLSLVLDLMVAALAITVVTLGVTVRSKTGGAAIGIALNNTLGFNASLRILVDSWTQLETSLGAISRIKSFEATVIPEDKEDEHQKPPQDWPGKGAVEFHNVTASYGPSAPAITNISMTVLPGQKVGICGRTGSGKSSLLLTLFRLLEIDSGTIVIDGVDIQQTPREDIRTAMTAIPQEPFILTGSVRNNADPFGQSTDEMISNALSKVQLWDIIQARGGLDANMKAQPLSQGQQQLFCLARSMIRKTKILVLDEATSNIDNDTDQLMQRVIREEFSDNTIITVAHRLDTILDSDKVAVLQEGILVEYGPPQELLSRQSKFRELYNG